MPHTHSTTKRRTFKHLRETLINSSNFAHQKYTPTHENSGSPSEKHPSMHIFAGFVTTASAVPPESLATTLVPHPQPEASALARVRQTVP